MKANAGDYVIREREDGTYDLSVITAAGSREPRGTDSPLADLAAAADVARAGLKESGGTQVWVCYHSRPDVLMPY